MANSNDAGSLWYNSVKSLSSSTAVASVTPDEIKTLATRAAKLHSEATAAANASPTTSNSNSNTNASEIAFFSKVVQSGTLSDRLSALTLMVQSNPMYNGKSLEVLKGMAERGKGRGGREESLKALRCVVDWWVGGGAPDRKLRYFRDQPLGHAGRTDGHLVVWYFEDWLKKYFFSVLQILETLSLDPLSYVRTQALTLIATLLRDKPEQEHNLLRLLVNKLGDPEKSICSRASYHILQVLQKHPQMKGIIVREVHSVVFQTPGSSSSAAAASSSSSTTPTAAAAAAKHIRFGDDKKSKPAPVQEKKTKNPHVQYYSVITLNQIVLAPGDQQVARQLINIYFDIFRDVIGEQGSTGAVGGEDKLDGGEREVEVDTKGRVRDKGKKKGKQGEQGEVKGAAGFVEMEDGSSRLVSAILTGVNRALPYAKLQTAGSDVYKHIDTLFAITHKSNFNTSIQAMVLIQQIASSLDSAATTTKSAATKSVIDRYYRTIYASLHDARLATSSKQAMYLNLLFKTIKQDSVQERVKAVVRRFVQVLVSGGSALSTEFVAGGLYLLGELFSTVPGLRGMVNGVPSKQAGEEEKEEVYDPKKRDPQYAHADSSPLWELTILLRHHHPAVALHARQLLVSQPLTASADLSQNTLSHFLDRFVYKNAKQGGMQEKGRGSSAMQPAASGVEGVKLVKGESVGGEVRVNDPAFVRKRVGDVAVDEMFFWKFFKEKSERGVAKAEKVGKRRGGDEESEEEEGDSDEEEVEEKGEAEGEEEDEEESESEASEGELDEDDVWKAMQATMPTVEDIPLGSEDEDDLASEDDDDAALQFSDSDDDVALEGSDDDDAALSLVEDSDNEDLIPLNDESDKEWGGVGDKRKREKEEDTAKGRRKKLKSLPTFASYEDYAKMIDDAPEDDI